MNRFLKDTVYHHAWLIIAAAWLFTLSFIFSNYWSYTSSPQGVRKNLENYLQRQERAFDAFASDTSMVLRFLHTAESEDELARNTAAGYGVFLYAKTDTGTWDLKYWNTQQIQPTYDLLIRPDGRSLERLSNGYFEFIKHEMHTSSGEVVLVGGLVPVHWKFFVENDYLQNGFAGNLGVDRNYGLSVTQTNFPVNSINGKTLYYLERRGSLRAETNDWITILLRVLGMILLLLYIHYLAMGISRHFGVGWGMALLVVVVVGLRILSYNFPIPVNYGQFELFSPRIYGSNIILRSLGDLLVNALLFLWITLYWRSQANKYGIRIGIRDKTWRFVLHATLMALLFFTTVLTGAVIRSLVSDSSISFDVTNFFSLTTYSVFGFLVLCCIAMGYFILSNILLQFDGQCWAPEWPQRAVLLAFTGLIFLSTRLHDPDNLFQLGLLAWLLFYVFLMGRFDGDLYRHFSGSATVFWIMVFSASITLIVITANTEREFELMRKGAEKKAYEADPASENVMSITVHSVTNDFLLANLPRFADGQAGKQIKDSIVNSYTQAYQNRFESKLFLYDTTGRPISAGDPLTYDTLNTIFTILGKKTRFPELRYYETSFDNYNYIFRREIRDSTALKGYFFLVSKPRRYQGESFYPELIKLSGDLSFEGSPNYSYAVYERDTLLYHQNDYPFSYRLDPRDVPLAEFDKKNRNGYQEIWYKVGNDHVVVITRKSNFLLEAITLFAWLFCIFLLLVGLFQGVSLMIRTGLNWTRIRDQWQLSIKNQIYGTIIFVSIFSFVVIFAATIVLFIQRFNRNNREKLSRTIQVMTNELKTQMDEQAMKNGTTGIYDSSNMANIQREISAISEIHNADLNLYDVNGSLLVSSQPFYYENGLISRKMDPKAFYEMKRLSRIQFIQDEHFGIQDYLSIYVPLHNEKRAVRAYLNIPYFASNRYLNQEISNFLVALINLNAFIILIGGVIAVFITNRITSSFSWIGEKMREVNLGRHNEEITWNRRDELGGLVNEYNKMVQKLEASAKALAKTEREGAWREMARQVAHEIKNPLTPMKLSIQYLQKAIDNNAPNVKELSSNVARTLIEQIEHLSKIASEFSQFANIGNARLEDFDLHELLHSLVSLHSMQDHGEVHWAALDKRLLIRADKTQINRLFTNLLQNAHEAVPEGREPIIRIREKLLGNNVVVMVQDNGSGIPVDTQAKIFIPNFTTKTSGTGLGLAMSKGIVEQARGEIWFETEEGKGTTFFVSLPLVPETPRFD